MTGTQKRILIVDDDDEIRELLEFDVAQSAIFPYMLKDIRQNACKNVCLIVL